MFRARTAGYGLLAVWGISTIAIAQNPPEPPTIDESRIVPVSEVTNRPFNDPGNATAKAVAEVEGISVGEATSRLRRQ